MSSAFCRTLRSLDADAPHRGLLLGAGALAAVWAAWFVAARVPVYEVTSSARLEVEAAVHPLAAQADGRVACTRLAIGREVRQGEVLVALDATEEQLALGEHRARHEGLTAKLGALRAQIAAEREAAARHRAARLAAIDELRAKGEEAAARSQYAERQVAALTRLRARAAASDDEYQRARSEADALRAAVKSSRLAAGRAERERDADETERRARIAGIDAEAVALAGDIATEAAAVRRLEHAIERKSVRAPVSGRVGDVAAAFRVGSVVRAGERLGAIVPAGEARAVALFPVAALGRIQPGQPARLRLHGFPWTQYGTVGARVSGVGDEASAGLIRVELRLTPDSESRIPIAHGLPGTAEIEVERVSPAVLVLRSAGRRLSARRGWSAPDAEAGP